MRKRKTVYLRDLIAKVNKWNREGTNSRESRVGANFLLGDLLHASAVYSGFRYLQAHEVPVGADPGVEPDVSGKQDHIYPDDSRREYYVHPYLRKT